MSAPQHTPGPWLVSSADSALAPGYVMTKGGTYVAKPLFNVEANARLIAAAPELLERLADVLPKNVCLTNRNIRDDMVVPLETTMGELRKIAATLAKARGEA